jgi:hypothetical protein
LKKLEDKEVKKGIVLGWERGKSCWGTRSRSDRSAEECEVQRARGAKV